MLDLLRPFFPGDWAQYGESLRLADGVGSSVAQWLAQPACLERALARHARTLNDAREPRAVASDWALRYFTALLPPLVVLSTLLRYSVPASSREMALQLNESGAPIAPLASLIDDRRQLLELPAWPDGRRNPLFLRHRQICVSHEGATRLLTLHAGCCLAYRLPRTDYCSACPVDPQHRRRARASRSSTLESLS